MILNKIIVLIVTAMPGVQRVVLFALIERFMGLKNLGIFSNDQFILQIISTFTMLGFAGLLMVRIPKLEESDASKYMTKIFSSSLVYTLISYIVIIILYKFDYIYDLNGAMIYLLGVGAYQLIRHFQISTKRYWQIFMFDLFVLIGIVILLGFIMPDSILSAIGLLYLSVFIVFIWIDKISMHLSFLGKSDLKKGMDISGTNFFSGAIGLLLVPIVTKILGIDYTALVGMSMVILSILLLLPYAIGLYLLPELAKYIGLKDIRYKTIYKKFIMYNSLILIAVLFLAFGIMKILSLTLYIEMFSLPYAETLFALLLFYTVSSQFTLPIANMIVALEETRLSVKINFYAFIFSFFSLSVLFFFNSMRGIFLLLICLIMVNIWRLWYMSRSVAQIIDLPLREDV